MPVMLPEALVTSEAKAVLEAQAMQATEMSKDNSSALQPLNTFDNIRMRIP